VSELQGSEKIVRGRPLCEEDAEKARKAEGGEEMDGWLEEKAIFLGPGKSRGLSLVCPFLEEWEAKQLEKEESELKERRRAREDRQLGGGLLTSMHEVAVSSGGGGYRGPSRGGG
jgi:hypothetical protein